MLIWHHVKKSLEVSILNDMFSGCYDHPLYTDMTYRQTYPNGGSPLILDSLILMLMV